MTYLLDTYAAISSLPDRVWLTLAFSVTCAALITHGFYCWRD